LRSKNILKNLKNLKLAVYFMYHDRCIPLFFEKMSFACTVATDVKCHVGWQIKGATSRYPMSLELFEDFYIIVYYYEKK
jgi:hypothetical protein